MKGSFIISSLLFFLISSVSKAQCVEIDSLVVHNVNCEGMGSIEIVASKGSAPYYYSIDAGASFHFSNLFNELEKGSYDVLVMDGNDCKSEEPITISEILELDIVLRSEGNNLIANIENAAYRWFDCNNDQSSIDGAFGNSFSCQKSGPYKVEVTLGNCIGTSDCERIDILETGEYKISDFEVHHIYQGKILLIHPEHFNPSDIQVYNLLGKIVTFSATKHLSGSMIDIFESPGVFIIRTPDAIFKVFN